ncbi:MAG: endonuclease/exonuclease/phosphatase family protein [Burkholderiaceae bacterium]|jgi:endonuclease/exonuclease/phosphatase family metal-dependent hydrolase|nr:endonuclease/exonuclease/phosphatase family protein [Burkholderiaceae bacterium]
MKLRVITYNIHKGVSAVSGRPRVHDLKKSLASLDADILFLQEVQGRHDRLATRFSSQWPQEAQHEFLAADHHHHAYGKNAIYRSGHHGNALLSAYPIISQNNQDISDHVFESRGLLHCTLQIDQTRVHCYVVHLGLFNGGRQRQTRMLIDCVKKTASPSEPIIIAGDFNDWGDQLSDALRDTLHVRDVFEKAPHQKGHSHIRHIQRLVTGKDKPLPASTFPAVYPCLPLDRIYVRGFSVRSAMIMHGMRWAKVSDHAPLVATLEIT